MSNATQKSAQCKYNVKVNTTITVFASSTNKVANFTDAVNKDIIFFTRTKSYKRNDWLAVICFSSNKSNTFMQFDKI